MASIPPIAYRWDGEAMRPLSSHHADQHLVIGERYVLVEHSERSQASHAHFFAAVGECWRSLPDEMVARFPSADHLRRYALIKSGFCDKIEVVCANNIEAMKVATLAQRDFSIVDITGNVVIVWTAKSQSMRAMGKVDFAASKEAVLNVLADMLCVPVGDLPKQVAA